MKETHIASFGSASSQTISQRFSRYVFSFFIRPISSICYISTYKSISYERKGPLGFFNDEVQSDWLSGLKFEIYTAVFGLHKGNLPVRINE